MEIKRYRMNLALSTLGLYLEDVLTEDNENGWVCKWEDVKKVVEENERLQKLHDSELGQCREYCDDVKELEEELERIKRKYRKSG